MNSSITACARALLLLGISLACADAAPSITSRGEVLAGRQTEVKSEVFGRIRKLHVELGDEVRKGDVLAEIDEEETLAKIKVLAPMAGTVLSLPVIERQRVMRAAGDTPATTLFVIGDLSMLLIETHFAQKDTNLLKLRLPVEITSEAIPDKKVDAVITFIAPISTPREAIKGHIVQARVDKPDARLRPGMFVQVTIPGDAGTQRAAVPLPPK